MTTACEERKGTRADDRPNPAGGGEIRRLRVVLLKPSKYDDDGYVIRYVRGVLPSNTLACLYALTEDVRRRKALGDGIEIETVMLDETVHRIDVRKIARRGRKRGTKMVVGLVGVQTNQFPRAYDLALQFRDAGIDVLLGGFHVGGMLSLFDDIPDDMQRLMDRGVSLVAGEVEDHWAAMLSDCLRGERKPLYNFLSNLPDMREQPVPVVNRKYLRRFAFPNFGTIDCGRGCPFQCSFCTIINVHGRKVRCRDAEVIARAIRENYREAGISFYFFTDDNFARNRHWEPIFDTLIRLREEEGIPIEFMMQVDVLAYRIENFVWKAKAAGCTNVFIGMESTNPENLAGAGKKQNVVEDFADLMTAFHEAGISTHVGFIIGFPADTVESVRQDVRTLIDRIRPELASFFMLTPLPGSMDHLAMVRDGVPMDADYNRYDSFHQTVRHPRLQNGEWMSAYKEAWDAFYSFENMKAILRQSRRHKKYWDTLWKFLWYKGSTTIEKNHPMITGFLRLKDRKIRRPGTEIESIPVHLRRRTGEVLAELAGWVRLLWEIQELWLQTRPQTAFETRLIREGKQLRESLSGRLTVFEWRAPRVRLRTAAGRVLDRMNVFSLRGIQSREDLNRFWSQATAALTSGRIYRIRPLKLVANTLRDMRLSVHFFRSVSSGSRDDGAARRLVPSPGATARRTAVALGIPKTFEGLRTSIEAFLRELGLDVVGGGDLAVDLGTIEEVTPVPDRGAVKVVRGYMEGLKGRADFVLLPFTNGLEGFHRNFVSGLSEIAGDVKERIASFPRVIHFPVPAADAANLKESLVRLGMAFTDDLPRIIAASEKAVPQAGG